MRFKNRTEAGKLLAKALESQGNEDVVVYALPRGGVVTALEVAKQLKAPLELVITRKIGHPNASEYAIAAITEEGHMVGNARELQSVDSKWLEEKKKSEQREAKRRREVYLADHKAISVENKVAILIDDGVATGLTMQVAILELRHQNPKKLIVAVPVAPYETALLLKKQVDDFIGLEVPEEGCFLGSVGAYYEDFSQVEDDEVISILKKYKGPESK